MPFGCPARGENSAFESNIYCGSASFHSKYIVFSVTSQQKTMLLCLFASMAIPGEHILLIDSVVRGVGFKGIALRILPGEHAIHPHILREGVQMMKPEKGHTVCDLHPHTQKPGQGGKCCFLICVPKRLQTDFTAQNREGRGADIAAAVTEPAAVEIFLAQGCDGLGSGEGIINFAAAVFPPGWRGCSGSVR